MNRNCFLLFLLTCSLQSTVFAQATLSGKVQDVQGQPLEGANVNLEPLNHHLFTNLRGFFKIPDIQTGEYVLTITYLGAKTFTKKVAVGNDDLVFSVTMEDDLLQLHNVVVTGTFDPRTQLESSTAITTLGPETLQQTFVRGTADLLQAIPGTFTDPSAGEVFTKVYNRGISASAEDDMGWYYVSLQENGLPVSLVQHSYYSPDMFQRLDLTTEKVEAIRGGSAAITSLNGPGGIYNFISSGPRESFGGEVQLQGGLQGEGNPIYRIDGVLGGPLGKGWFFNAGGHYRHDDGGRNVDFTFSKGGQFRFNVIKKTKGGYFKFYGKLLDDFTNRWTGLAAVDWNRPHAAYEQDFNTTALLMPTFESYVPDGRKLDEGATIKFDPSQGLHAKDQALRFDILQDLGNDWSLKFQIKYSHKNADWQTSISNAFVSLDNPLAYFISGAEFPIGQVVFRDARSGSEVARVDNSGILTGQPATYIGEGTMPYDAIMGAGSWAKQIGANEVVDQLTIRKKAEKHDLTVGLASGFVDTSLFTQGSFGYATYEPNPRMLQVSVENLGEPAIALSDANGLSNYGGLFFDDSQANVLQMAAFADDRWKIQDRLQLDIGLRYETVKFKGAKARSAPFQQDGGLDGDSTTAYDNGVLAPTGEKDAFNDTYGYLSYSAGLNYRLEKEAALFIRFSSGNKAPELNYYFNNFSNVPINQKGEVQKIRQTEIGLKWDQGNFSFTTTAFWSQLKDIGIASFEFDSDDGRVFYSPVQFNDSRTIGLEWESAYSPISMLTFRFNGTLQDPVATKWTVYDSGGTVDTSDDSAMDFSGNALPFNPKLMFNLGAEVNKDKFNGFLKWQFMGEREGNVANVFQLSAYSIFNAGVGYTFNEHFFADFMVTNLFDSQGLTNFFGANSFGANANGVTAQYIRDNPDASFVVVPVLPRGAILKLGYRF